MKTNFLNSRSKVLTLKMLAIFFLIMLLLVPKFMVEDLVSERNRLNESVSHEVSSHWSGDQFISGPYLVIPYWNQVYNESNKTYDKIESQVIVFPESLDITGILSTTSKYRSLYNVLLYESNIKINGEFKMPDFKEINILKESLIWDKAMLRFPFSDSKGINSEIKFNVDSTPLILKPGMGNFKCTATNNNQDDEYTHSLSRIFPTQNSFNTGLSCKFPIVEGKTNYHFNLEMSLKGSSSLLFSPIAKTTQVKLSSTFKDPSFVGEFLPEHNLSNSGFEANWKILEYNKSIPSLLKDTYTIDLGKNLFGVIIKTPMDNYAKTTRACKYMILFIALIFLSIFLTEILRNIQVHVFQYALMGFALITFFALLLSVSEFVNFNVAYIMASSAVIIMIYMYSLSIFQQIQSTRLLSGLVICLFGFIFIIIQLEQMALLVGTVGLFVILGICMYVTRKIKWYEEVSKE